MQLRVVVLSLALAVVVVAVVVVGAGVAEAQPSTWVFESIPSRPLALSSDATRLYSLNTPDGHLEIYDVSGALPVRLGSVPVGLDPVAVALRDDGEAWVVNKVSDSVSIVDLAATPPRVKQTLLVGDEPSDVVFASGRAFVTTARRGQNTAEPLGAYQSEGVGRAWVWVFDAANPGTDLLPAPITVLTLFSDKPRALAVSPDGTTVYAAAFLSGNQTTTVTEGAVCDGPTATPCDLAAGTAPGGLPTPQRNHLEVPGPATGLIVRFDAPSGLWIDELSRDWSPMVRFSLPDYDVFVIDADAPTPSVTSQLPGVGTVLFGMATNPVTGRLYVANTEARNEVRFEGMGTYVRANGLKPDGVPASVRGHLHEARVTVIDGVTVTPRHLNPHLDYDAVPQPADAKLRSLAQPTALAVSADGSKLYVAGFGSGVLAVIPTVALEGGTYAPAVSDHVTLTGGGPTGVVLDEARDRGFVATRFDSGISVVKLSTKQQTGHVVMHTPEPAEVIWGRQALYDARFSSSTGEASCGSCHVFGDLDGLAWDLGDPDGDVMTNTNPYGPIGFKTNFHPLKGPMTTQTFRGISNHGPMHWRGDRTGGGSNAGEELAGFLAFSPAFPGLLGRDEGELPAEEMELFAAYALKLVLPPNPMRRLDNALRAPPETDVPSELRGFNIYMTKTVDSVATCNGCHVLDRSQGFFGSSGLMTFENEPQEMKVAGLRNIYDKVGMFGMAESAFITSGGPHAATGEQVRGFGFLHDGSIDTIFRFLGANVFSLSNQEQRDLEALMMVFDTDLAPIVGQSVTIDAASTAEELARRDLLVERAGAPLVLHGTAAATECDLVVHGVVGGEARGFLRQSDGSFTSDRQAEAARSLAELTALAQVAGQGLTFLCAPPGTGNRMALDRDEDGVRDRDELDQGRSPIDRPVPPRPGSQPVMPDAGMPDARTVPMAEGDSGGCSCGVSRTGSVPWVLVLLGGVALVGIRVAGSASRGRGRGARGGASGPPAA
jgi:DNA-binding beta-propeller fold protein YncE